MSLALRSHFGPPPKKNLYRKKFVLVLLSASVMIFSVTSMRDFLTLLSKQKWKGGNQNPPRMFFFYFSVNLVLGREECQLLGSMVLLRKYFYKWDRSGCASSTLFLFENSLPHYSHSRFILGTVLYVSLLALQVSLIFSCSAEYINCFARLWASSALFLALVIWLVANSVSFDDLNIAFSASSLHLSLNSLVFQLQFWTSWLLHLNQL